jgi:branched-chain amino acid transport system permease protein
MDAFAGAAVLMMVLLGGMGSLWGPFIGAALFIFIQDYISTMTEHWELFVGLAVILLVLFMPRGVVGLGDYLRRSGKE